MKRIMALLITLGISVAVYGYSVEMKDGKMSKDYRYVYEYRKFRELPSDVLPTWSADCIGYEYMKQHYDKYEKAYRVYLYTDNIIKSSDWELFLQ